ncbi:hypothetical protein WJX73_006372 [Symbiochloris irregularis]|uniref:Phosphatidate phosphatase APP1 catalytic domain-containing protein n=1 Tax=Symbiochloris irregularis TaxID=706552 RepID=A0AAW1P809_9CHLO
MFLPLSWPTLVFCVLLIVYVGDDRTPLHFSRTVRRFYWAILSALITWIILTTLNRFDFERAEGVWIIVIAVIAASLVEDQIQRQRNLRPFTSKAVAIVQGTPEAQGKAEYLTSVIHTANEWQGSTIGIAKFFSLARGRLQRHRNSIREVLKSSHPTDLNYMLLHVNCAALLEIADATVLPVLTSPNCLHHLSVITRAALLDALQKVGMRHRPMRQLWAKEIIVNTFSGDLSRLKALLDDGGDYHTTFKLVYSDLQGNNQKEVKRHMQVQGQKALSAFQRQHPQGPPGISLKVISDIDDTLMCSGGRWPAGRDKRLPPLCVYPGVLALYNELDLGHMQRIEASKRAAEEHKRSMLEQLWGGSSGAESDAEEEPRPQRERSSLNPQRSGLLAATTLLLRTTASEVATMAQHPVRTGRSVLFGEPPEGEEPDVEPPSPRTVKRGIRTTLSRPLQGGEATAGSRSAEAARRREAQQRRRDRPATHANHLVFLSARPESYRGWTEELSLRSIFDPLIISGDMPGPPVLLMGSLRSGPQALYDYSVGTRSFRGSPRTLDSLLASRLAKRKLQRFKEYAALYPECCWVFIGDNGQGDVLVAEKLEQEIRGPDGQQRVLASFIHSVIPAKATVSYLQSSRYDKYARLAAWRDRNIYFHKTHVGMAVQAFTLGFMEEAGLHVVALEAVTALRRVRARFAFEDVDWGRVIRQLNRDLRAANACLPDELQISLIAIPTTSAVTSRRTSTVED